MNLSLLCHPRVFSFGKYKSISYMLSSCGLLGVDKSFVE